MIHVFCCPITILSQRKKERGKMPSGRVEAIIPRKSLGTATGEDKVSWLMKEVREGA